VKEEKMFAKSSAVLIAMTLAWPMPATADVITEWDQKAIGFVTPRMPPPQQHRILALVHAAMFDAVNSIDRRYQPYLLQLPASLGTSKEAAAATAAATVLATLHKDAESQFKAELSAYLGTIPDGAAKTEGIALGEATAAKVVAVRSRDGAGAAGSYRPRTQAGIYVATPTLVAANWPGVTPFALERASQFRPAPPIALESARWATDFNEIKKLGSRTSSERSPQQTENARFWLMTGPQAYHPIARQLIADPVRGR
jgi:hypothetical protein